MPNNYTEAQIADIKEREAKALAALSELQLTPTVAMTMVHVGNDTFAIKPIPYLADTKYTATLSPIQVDDLPPPGYEPAKEI